MKYKLNTELTKGGKKLNDEVLVNQIHLHINASPLFR